jgi:hypothetical protein
MGMDSRLPIFRKITQVLSLIFCVGLFVLGFNEFQSVRPLLINHNYSLPNPWLFKTLLAVVLILGWRLSWYGYRLSSRAASGGNGSPWPNYRD